MILLVAFVLAVAGRVQGTSGPGCTVNEFQKLLASDGADGDQFGFAVSLDGNVAIFAVWHDDDNGDSSGSAYIFRFDGTSWTEEAKLLASDGATNDQFGYSVSIDGDVAIVGAILDDDNGSSSGSAYIFRFDGTNWTEEAKLLASDGATNDQFGISVSIDGDVALIGAQGDDDNGSSSGSAFIFRFDGKNWNEEAKLLALDGAAADHFGFSASLDGNVAIVGAYTEDNENGVSAGSVYSFRFNSTNWVQEAKLLASDGAVGDQLGFFVSIDGDVVIAGAPRHEDNGPESGAAFIFRFDGANWNEEAKLLASDGAPGDGFGKSVSIDGAVAIVGASADDDNGFSSGSAYVFRFDGRNWNEEAKLLASDGEASDTFGRSVSIGGDVAIVGAYFDDNENGGDAGSAYIFANLNDCNGNGTADICDIANGDSQDENGNGIPDECEGCTANELQKLLASDGEANDNFGWSVAISGDAAIVGAREDDDNGTDAGSAFILRFDGTNWNEEAKLLASDGAANDRFGSSVSISGDVVLVGAIFDDDNGTFSGSAYIFRFDGASWNEEAKLLASEGAADDRFGTSVSIDGDVAIVGANLDDNENGSNGGSTYIFRFDGANWNQEAKLLASDGAENDRFGSSVSLDGDVALVGAVLDADNGTDSGSAYVFRFDGANWNEEAKLLASDGAAFDIFGRSVSLDGDVALVGADFDDDNGTNAGSAFIFRFDGANWNEEVKLLAADGAANDFFGFSVSLDGDVAMVGAYSDEDEKGVSVGSVLIFRFDGTSWHQQAKLLPSGGAANDWFGRSVSLNGDTAIVGSPFDDDNGSKSGSAYVFTGVGDCNENGTVDICDIADGTSQDENGNGIPDECEPADCPWDLDANGTVGATDLLSLLVSWGPCDDCNDCPADFDGNCTVGATDLLALLVNWGPCP